MPRKKKPQYSDYHKQMLEAIRTYQEYSVFNTVMIVSEPHKERHLTGDESDEQILNYLALNNVKEIVCK
jgi:hypothetical protein